MPRKPLLAYLVVAALLIAGCDPTASSSQPTAEASLPTAESPAAAALATESSTSAATATASPTATAALTDTLQIERITINAAGELEPSVITATAGLSIELTLVNRSEADALLTFDLAPAGALGIPLPAVPSSVVATLPTQTETAVVTPTAAAGPTAVPEPTARLILVPTFSATSVGSTTTAATSMVTASPTPSATPTAVVTATAMPTSGPGGAQAERIIRLRYDQPGSYEVRCAPPGAAEPAGCIGTVTIAVVPPGSAPAPSATPAESSSTIVPIASTSTVTPPEGTATVTPPEGTATITGTAIVSGTATLTVTALATAEAAGTPTATTVVTTTATSVP